MSKKILKWREIPVSSIDGDYFIQGLPKGFDPTQEVKFHRHGVKNGKSFVEYYDVEYEIIEHSERYYIKIYKCDINENYFNIHFHVITEGTDNKNYQK